MNARSFYAIVPLAALLSAPAGAQGVVTRPLDLSQDQQTTVYRTIVREQAVPQTRTVTRKQMRQTVRRPAPNHAVRTTTRERIVARPAMVEPAPVARQRIIATQPQQRIIATQPTTFVTADPLELTQQQRTVVYRTLVQPPLQPAPVVSNRIVTAPRPLVTAPMVAAPVEQRVITTTEPAYGQRVISTIDPVFGERVITTAPQTTGVGTVIVNDPLVREGAFGELAIGSRIPASIPVYVMPASLAAAAPTIGGYHYALIGDRVYLVDPRDGIVVGMLYQ